MLKSLFRIGENQLKNINLVLIDKLDTLIYCNDNLDKLDKDL